MTQEICFKKYNIVLSKLIKINEVIENMCWTIIMEPPKEDIKKAYERHLNKSTEE